MPFLRKKVAFYLIFMQIVVILMQHPIYLHDLSLQVRKFGQLKYSPSFVCSQRKDALIMLTDTAQKLPCNKLLCAIEINTPLNTKLTHNLSHQMDLKLSFYQSLNGTTVKRLNHFSFSCKAINITKAIDDHYRLLLNGYNGSLGIKGLSNQNDY